jgi:biopolymer transport protein ExbD
MSIGVGPAGGTDDVVSEMNTTPLIDVMLVLLVMLILTIPIQTHAVKIDLPHIPVGTPPPVVVNLEIDFDGTPIWNGTPLANAVQLDLYLQDSASRMPQPEVHVRPHRLAKYDAVAKALPTPSGWD